ncbi:MAG: hypothetical protein IJE43_02155 [Alphaproteobacteria bacterium]|nr:hypothetical protein [Alphaproteobacteria bacterium]
MKDKIVKFINKIVFGAAKHFEITVMVLFFSVIILMYITAEPQSKETVKRVTDYILTYATEEVQHISFTAKKVVHDSRYYRTIYYLEDGSEIYVANGVITWVHENGAVDNYTNGFITAH